jgi:hypothetical protein
MTAATRRHVHRRRCAHVVLLALLAAGFAVMLPAAAPARAAAAAAAAEHDTVEVWKLHPTKSAARAAHLTLRVSDVAAGDRGALMIVEDRHVPVTPFDTGGVYGFVYAELGNDHDYPQAYDNADGIRTPDCPAPSSCAGLEGRPLSESPLAFTFSKVVDSTGRPYPYDFHDFYVGAVNAHVTVFPQSSGWSVSRATNADMVLVQNSDTANGVGARTANYSVEQFNGEIAVKTPKALWSVAYVRLPCSADLVPYPVPQGRATFTGLTIPYGRKAIPLSCDRTYAANGLAVGPTTWRLTSQSTGTPGNVSAVAATQNLNRMVVLIVDRTTPGARAARPPTKRPLPAVVSAIPARHAPALAPLSPQRDALRATAFVTSVKPSRRQGNPLPAALLLIAFVPVVRVVRRRFAPSP